MARMKHGPYGPITGKLGNTVGYIRLGQPVLRMIKHPTTKPATPKQEAARARLRLVSGFIKMVNHFTNISFKPFSRRFIGKTAQNMAISANLQSAVAGEYPDYVLDGSKLILSRGGMQLPENCAVELAGENLRFSWTGDHTIGFPYSTEQVMMLAWFPESGRAVYLAGGARRTAGEDVLALQPGFNDTGLTETYVEAYIAFVANDRTDVTDSLYLGQVVIS
jgi:hypothetical protein